MTTLADIGAVAYYSQSQAASMERDAQGRLVVRGLPIFKSGSFKDSKGRRHTVTDEHLAVMVENFTQLRQSGVLPNVPVRLDHTQSVRDIVGYFDGVHADGSQLLCDFTLTDPDAADKYENGTYRSRSCEVGPYEANDGTRYNPVAQGFAFVDLPAVEGLFSKNVETKEPVPVPEPQNDPKPATFRVRGVPTTDVGAVQTHIDGLEAEPEPTPHTFRLATGAEADFAKVQTYIDGLESAIDTIAMDTRATFVKSLAEGKDVKIAASQVESLTDLAKTMSAEQFASFRKTYEDAPVLPTFARHGGTNDGAPGDPESDATDRRSVLETTVLSFRRAGMAEETIAKTAAAKELAALGAK